MKRFGIWMVVLWLSCMILTTTIQLMGQIAASPVDILFTNEDGTPCQQPCLLGVQPGRTSFQDGVRIVRAHPVTRGLTLDVVFLPDEETPDQAIFMTPDSAYTIRVSKSIGDDTVAFVHIGRTAHFISNSTTKAEEAGRFGDLLTHLGLPQYIQYHGTSVFSVTFRDNRFTIVCSGNQRGVSPTGEWLEITLYGEPISLGNAEAWRGFRYYAAR